MSDTVEPLPVPENVLTALRDARSVVLTGHERPDGDCIGAQAGLAQVLKALGKQVRILNPDPPEAAFDYLTKELSFGCYPDDEIPEHDICVLLDISELGRCGSLARPLAAAASKKLVIDHHVHHGEEWWDLAFVDRTASATGVLVYRIASALGVELDTLACKGLFTSLVTDTGWFKYSNTDAETLSVAAKLVAQGVQPHRLYSSIYQRNPASLPYELSGQLGELEYFADGRLALLVADPEGPAFGGNSEVLLDILRSVDQVEVVLFLRQASNGHCKLSARSKGEFDVNALARRFGGGGHVKASGATLEEPLLLAREVLLAAALEEFGHMDMSGAQSR